MKIGILGSGEMGRSLGKLWSERDHNIFFGTRNIEKLEEWIVNNNVNAEIGTYLQAAEYSDIVLLSTLWEDTENAIKVAGSFKGKILIDCTNPEGKDGLVIGHTTSGAEEIAKWANGAKIVKAFNHIYGSMLRYSPQFEGHNALIFYCGDDEESKKIVVELAKEIGLNPVDAGELKISRYLEPLAGLWTHLARNMKWGGENIGLGFLNR